MEWQYAAEGGTQHFYYPWGNDEPSDQLCWARAKGTCVTRSFPPESYGLFDMGGNVSEYTVAQCKTCEAGSAFLSGGNWWHTPRYDVGPAFSSHARTMTHGPATWAADWVGFRCAK